MKKLILLWSLMGLIGSQVRGQPATVKVDPHFLGDWIATSDCEKHPTWPSEITIFKDPKNPQAFQLKRGKAIIELNTAGEVVEKDFEGQTFRTVRMPESYNEGKQLVVGSLWKGVNEARAPFDKSLSVIMTVYKLIEDTMVFEKYGYESEERPNGLMLQPYNKNFPKNYHCVFKRGPAK